MIVHEPEISRQDNEVILSSKIEINNQSLHSFPSKLYFAFPIEYEPYINLQIDAFAFSMLMIAMRLGEDLEIKGPISPRLAIGMQEHNKIFSHFYKKLPLKEIKINFASFRSSEERNDSKRFGATSFSGGVDSTHMCWNLQSKHLEIPFTDFKYAFFIQGLDNPLDDTEGFLRKANEFKSFLDRMGITLITPRTNFILFSQLILPWPSVCHVPVLSAAIVLSGLIKHYIIPSTYSYNLFHVTGSSLLSDHWISTEDLEVFHFGSHTYINKLETVSELPGFNAILRVCSNKRVSLHGNCSRCNKCLRSMAFLKLIGKYEDFPTFKQPFSYFDILKWGWVDFTAPEMKQIFISAAFKKKKIILLSLGIISALLSFVSYHSHNIIKKIIPEKAFIDLKKKIYPVERDRLI